MKVSVDALACDGYAKCARIAPSLFRMDEINVAVVLVDTDLTEVQTKLADMAAKMCPSKAIHLNQ